MVVKDYIWQWYLKAMLLVSCANGDFMVVMIIMLKVIVVVVTNNDSI